jgi:sirohydrochlorin ferrochelatase
MRCVLVVAHGSKAKPTEETFDAVLGLVRDQLPGYVIESAYMQISEKSMHLAIADLAKRGATEIKVVPYFLFSGMHILQDIPEMLEGFAKEYPMISFTLAKTLGADRRLADILVDRIVE